MTIRSREARDGIFTSVEERLLPRNCSTEGRTQPSYEECALVRSTRLYMCRHRLGARGQVAFCCFHLSPYVGVRFQNRTKRYSATELYIRTLRGQYARVCRRIQPQQVGCRAVCLHERISNNAPGRGNRFLHVCVCVTPCLANPAWRTLSLLVIWADVIGTVTSLYLITLQTGQAVGSTNRRPVNNQRAQECCMHACRAKLRPGARGHTTDVTPDGPPPRLRLRAGSGLNPIGRGAHFQGRCRLWYCWEPPGPRLATASNLPENAANVVCHTLPRSQGPRTAQTFVFPFASTETGTRRNSRASGPSSDRATGRRNPAPVLSYIIARLITLYKLACQLFGPPCVALREDSSR